MPRERYLERCELKTARLFEAACRLGALLGAPGPGAARTRWASSAPGSAWRSRSSTTCSTCPGPPERTGKPRGTDLLDGTVTLPLIIARERDGDLRRLDLREVVTSPEQADAFCDRIAADRRARARRASRRSHFVAEAKAALYDAAAVGTAAASARPVADGVVERYA